MLFLVGLGLDAEGVTLKGIKAVEQAECVYLEKYTSSGIEIEQLEKIFNKKIIPVHREEIEGEKEEAYVLEQAKTKKVALLIVGTPLFATTHIELFIRAKELGIKVEVVHNASIQSVMGCCGFNSYSFGPCVSIPFFLDNWRPYEFYKRIESNIMSGCHTLCLLDIKINEPTLETLMGKENKRYTKYMSIIEAIEQIEEAAKHWSSEVIKDIYGVAVERLGQETEKFTYGTFKDLKQKKFGAPLHSLIIISPRGNQMERDCIKRFFAANK